MTPFNKYNYFKLSVIEDSVENVLINFRQYLTEGGNEFKSVAKAEVDFNLVCDKPELDYNSEDYRFLLFEPRTSPGKTVFFSNLMDGWHTAVYNYARLFKKEVYQIGVTVNSELKEYPAYFFVKFFYDEEDEFQRRVVHLIKESHWTFYENSEKVKPLEIEDTRYYDLKRKTDRLNTEIILDYMKKAGCDMTDEIFFKSNKLVYYCEWKYTARQHGHWGGADIS